MRILFFFISLLYLLTEIKGQGFCVINAQSDTLVCQAGVPVQLTASPGALSYEWTASGISPITAQNPVVYPSVTTTYHLRSLVVSPTELISNGNFTGGNSGFTSSYTYSVLIHNEGYYYVTSWPSIWHTGFSACVDHTTGNGNMMVINGANIANVSVWSQTINVVPNTDYAFSTWVQSLHFRAPAILQFSVNGVLLGTPLYCYCNYLCVAAVLSGLEFGE